VLTYDEALAYLEAHINLEVLPPRSPGVARSLDRMRALMDALGDPHRAYPSLHLTGTNGKGSTARILSALLAAQGLSVATYTSPHLERINERWAWNLEAVSDAAFAETISALADIEPLVGAPERRRAGHSAFSHFELLTAGAFRWFADVAVDAAVVEVGLGGTWDATNVVDGDVAVVTNVAVDHAEYLGPTRHDIATEKAGIVKPNSTLVLGETDPGMAAIFRSAGAARVIERYEDFGCEENRPAVGGRMLDLRTPHFAYRDVYLPLHGAHQGDNAALALAAAEAFFDGPLGEDVVNEAFAAVTVPGRLEVVGRRPLTLLDGAHNPAGAAVLAEALAEEFPVERGRILVVGMLAGRDPVEMLEALDAREARLVLACVPPSPRALPADEVARAAESLGIEAEAGGSVPSSVNRALALADEDEQVVITGSLYVVGAARTALVT
jgi:dihydrofolate synthase/folylpolyglutamate synthase